MTRTGGVDLFPPGAAIPADDYATSAAEGVPFEVLDAASRGPVAAMVLPDGHRGALAGGHLDRPAGRGDQGHAAARAGAGAVLREPLPVVASRRPRGRRVERTPTVPCRCLPRPRGAAADAWTNDLLGPLGVELPLTVTLEQVTYFRPDAPRAADPAGLPLWIWMDDPSYYGFPVYEARPAGQGRAGLRRSRHHPGRAVLRARPGRRRRGWPHRGDAAGPGARCGRSRASTP